MRLQTGTLSLGQKPEPNVESKLKPMLKPQLEPKPRPKPRSKPESKPRPKPALKCLENEKRYLFTNPTTCFWMRLKTCTLS